MTNKIFIKHHLGFGDCIVHNGMVRKLSKDNPDSEIWVSSYHHNLENVKFMYRDNPKINIVGVSSDLETNNHLDTTQYDLVISTFISGTKYNDYSKYGDDAFYLLVEMSPNIKTEYFNIERDYIKEQKIYEELIINQNIDEYIFIHEKEDQGILIDRNKIKNNLPIIYAEKKYKTFELLGVIEKAKECHIISSSFLSLFMCKKYNQNVFAHMYSDRIELQEYIKKNGINIII
jgi:hypothetical protein